VRDGAVEESERLESDDLGLRVFVGRKTGGRITNDIAGTSAAALAERAVAMARVAPEDPYAGLADARASRINSPISISSIRTFRRSYIWRSLLARRSRPGLR